MTTFTPHQDSALKAVADWMKAKPGKNGTPPVFRLFGYAGTGKTTLARHIADGVDGEVKFAAFTGKAGLRFWLFRTGLYRDMARGLGLNIRLLYRIVFAGGVGLRPATALTPADDAPSSQMWAPTVLEVAGDRLVAQVIDGMSGVVLAGAGAFLDLGKALVVEFFGRVLTDGEPIDADLVVFLGDYIDRGPDSRGGIDLLLKPRDIRRRHPPQCHRRCHRPQPP